MVEVNNRKATMSEGNPNIFIARGTIGQFSNPFERTSGLVDQEPLTVRASMLNRKAHLLERRNGQRPVSP